MKKITLTLQKPETQDECNALREHPGCSYCMYFPRGFCQGNYDEMKNLQIRRKA